jgi:2'-5' RNA ligase
VSLRTALVLPLDEPRLAALRKRFDPVGTAAGIPPHITLLIPFAAPDAVDHAPLEAFFARWTPLRLALARVEEFPGVVWLAPEPVRDVRERILEVYARFPEFPPYEGEFLDPVPHATVGAVPEESAQADVAAGVRAAAEPLLPLELEVRAASLLEEVAPGRWREAARFPFRGAP